MREVIKIDESFLIFRKQVHNLENIILNKIKKSRISNFYLDFSNVRFVSRSFADELLNLFSFFKKKGVKIQTINQNSFIQQLFKVVINKKEKIKKEIVF